MTLWAMTLWCQLSRQQTICGVMSEVSKYANHKLSTNRAPITLKAFYKDKMNHNQLLILFILYMLGPAFGGNHFTKSKNQATPAYQQLKLSAKNLPFIRSDQSLNCVPLEARKLCSGDQVILSTAGLHGFVNAHLPSSCTCCLTFSVTCLY